MSNSTLFSTILFAVVFSSNSFGQCADPTNVHSFNYNGTDYELIRENVTWQDAAACALSRGGYLVEINDASENIALFAEITTNAGITNNNTVAPDGGGGAYVWIGGNDFTTEGSWVWDGDNTGSILQFWQGTSSGNPVGGLFNNWGNEPDDFNGQDALGISLNSWPLGVAGEWNDVDDQNELYFLVEYPSTAGSIELENELELYPNPFDDIIRIKSAEQISEVIITTSLGQKIKQIKIDSQNEIEFNVANLDPNIYLIELILDNGNSIVRKLTK